MSGNSTTNSLKLIEEFAMRISENNGIDPALALNVFRLIVVHSEKGGLSDNEIEELSGLRQIEVRKVLRVLYEARLIEMKKERDAKQDIVKYTWYIDSDVLNFNLLKRKKLTLEKLKERLGSEKKNEWYECPSEGIRFSLHEAFEVDFVCPRCGSPLEMSKGDCIEKLSKHIAVLEEEIAEDEKNLFAN
ncbi:MAG: hypothetical protein QXN05_03100 [Acidilobaceae archaeon]